MAKATRTSKKAIGLLSSDRCIILKTYPSLLNYFRATSLAITLKVSSSERKIVFFVDRKCPNFSMRLHLIANARKVDVSELQVKN